MKKFKKVAKGNYRLLVRVVDHSQPVQFDHKGNKYVQSEWIEVDEINLGSKKNPNKDVLEVRFEPIRLEREYD